MNVKIDLTGTDKYRCCDICGTLCPIQMLLPWGHDERVCPVCIETEKGAIFGEEGKK